MIRGLAVLILLNISALTQAGNDAEQISWTVVKPGDNVTILHCSAPKNEIGLFYWYKQRFGYWVQTVAKGTLEVVSLQGQFVDSRFSATNEDTGFSLNIANVTKEDEATYFCQAGSAYEIHFINSSILTVDDQKNQMPVYVKQHPSRLSVEPGQSVTLRCSLLSGNKEKTTQCPGERDVHWFRAGSGEHRPSILYSHKNKSEVENKRKCIYHLSKTIQDSSDSGTYYCAVATCGQILFGEGTKVKIEPEIDPAVIAHGVVLALCVTVIAILCVLLSRSRVCEHCKNVIRHLDHERRTGNQSRDMDGGAKEFNYLALTFSARTKQRYKKKREQDRVYSAVRYYPIQQN